MLGLMRAARNLRLPPGPPPKGPKDVLKILGQAFLLALLVVTVVGGPFILLRLADEYFHRPPPCTCEMTKNHECTP